MGYITEEVSLPQSQAELLIVVGSETRLRRASAVWLVFSVRKREMVLIRIIGALSSNSTIPLILLHLSLDSVRLFSKDMGGTK